MALVVKFKRLRNIIDSIDEVGLVDLSKEDQELVKLILRALQNDTGILVNK